MRIFARMLAPVLGAALWAPALAQDMEIKDCQWAQKTASRFSRWVRPDYPPALVAARQSGVVDVHIDVDDRGMPADMKFESTPANESLEAAVKDVATHWRYRSPVAKSCEPIPSKVHARVHFRIDDDTAAGKPAVSLEQVSPVDSRSACDNGPRLLNGPELIERFRESFPRVARRTQSEGTVYVAVTAVAATGLVKDVEVVRVIEGGSAKREFSNAAIIVNREARFEPRAGASPEETVRICRSVDFRLNK